MNLNQDNIQSRVKENGVTIPGLNGLRAISILLVIFSHVLFREHLLTGPLADGQLGVTVFFVLSGFLITWMLLREEQSKGTVSIKSFFLRRTLRLFPAYYTLLGVYAVMQAFHLFTLSPSSWLTSLTFTKYFNRALDWESSHLWSLSVEEHFYIFWILCFKWVPKYRVRISIILICVAPLIRMFDYWSDSVNLTQLHFLTRMDGMLWGCLLAMNYTRFREFIMNCMERIPGFIWVPFLSLALIISFPSLNQIWHLHMGFLVVALTTQSGTLTDLAIVGLIVITIECSTAWSKFLQIKWIDWLGKLSYSLYLWQQIFFSDSLGGMALPLRLLLILLAAMTSFYLVEKPFLKLKQLISNKAVQEKTQTNRQNQLMLS